MDEVEVAGGSCVIRREKPFAEWEKAQLRAMYQTREQVEAGLALGEALNEVLEKMLAEWDRVTEAIE